MSDIKRMRQALGLSQYDVAAYLGVSRSLVSLAEKNLRTLPFKAFVELSKLQLSLLDRNQGKGIRKVELLKSLEPAKWQQDQFIKICRKKISDSQWNIVGLKRQLERMKGNYNKAIAAIETIEAVAPISNKASETLVEFWSKYKRSKLEILYFDNGPMKQKFIENQIKAELYNIKLFEKTLEEFSSKTTNSQKKLLLSQKVFLEPLKEPLKVV